MQVNETTFWIPKIPLEYVSTVELPKDPDGVVSLYTFPEFGTGPVSPSVSHIVEGTRHVRVDGYSGTLDDEDDDLDSLILSDMALSRWNMSRSKSKHSKF